MYRIKQFASELKAPGVIGEWFESRVTRSEYTVKFLTRYLKEIKEDGLRDFVSGIWAVSEIPGHLKRIFDNNRVESIKTSLATIAEDEGSPDEIIERAHRADMDVSTISELMCFYKPRKYAVKNKRSKWAMSVLTGSSIYGNDWMDLRFPKYDNEYPAYSFFIQEVADLIGKFCDLLKTEIKAKDKCEAINEYRNNIPFLTVDAYFCFIYDKDKEAGYLPGSV